MNRLFSGNSRNKNFNRNLQKLEYIILSSMRHNSHKKNYNAAATLLVSMLKPKVNRGNIRYEQKQNFIKQFGKWANVVNNRATSSLARQIANDPYKMRSYFNRKNRGFSNGFLNVLAGKPRINTSRPAFGRPVTGSNLARRTPTPRANLSRRPPPPRVNLSRRPPPPRPNLTRRPPPPPRPNLTRRSGSSCSFKKLNFLGRPICK
jgi:hypothetical protein